MEGRGPLGTSATSGITGPWASGGVEPGLTWKSSSLQRKQPHVVSPSCNNNKNVHKDISSSVIFLVETMFFLQ